MVVTRCGYSVISDSNVHSDSVTNTMSNASSSMTHSRAISSCGSAASSALVPRTPAIITGIVLIAAGMALIGHSGEWLLVPGGLLSILLGVILLFQPSAGVVALSWLFGFYALLFGILFLSVAFRIRYHPA